MARPWPKFQQILRECMWDGAEEACYVALESDSPGLKLPLPFVCVTLGTWLSLSESPLLCPERLPTPMSQD